MQVSDLIIEFVGIRLQLFCIPTANGGLGMIDLRLFGFALRMRWEWLARVEPDRGWVRLPAKKEKVVTAMFDASCVVRLGEGTSAKFWKDGWLSVGPLYSAMPNLFKTIRRSGCDRSVRDAL